MDLLILKYFYSLFVARKKLYIYIIRLFTLQYLIYYFVVLLFLSFYYLWGFRTSFDLRSFTLNLRESKSLQVSRTLLSILADLNSAMVQMVSFLPQISNSFSLFSRPLETVPSASYTFGITDTFMSHSFLSLELVPSICFLPFFHFHPLISWRGGYPRSVMVKAMDGGIVVREFVL